MMDLFIIGTIFACVLASRRRKRNYDVSISGSGTPTVYYVSRLYNGRETHRERCENGKIATQKRDKFINDALVQGFSRTNATNDPYLAYLKNGNDIIRVSVIPEKDIMQSVPQIQLPPLPLKQ